MTRDELQEKIRAAEAEAAHSGPMHRRDLQKYIRRMRAQLARCGRAEAADKQGVG